MSKTVAGLFELEDWLEENDLVDFTQEEIDRLLAVGLKVMDLCISETVDRDISGRDGR